MSPASASGAADGAPSGAEGAGGGMRLEEFIEPDGFRRLTWHLLSGTDMGASVRAGDGEDGKRGAGCYVACDGGSCSKPKVLPNDPKKVVGMRAEETGDDGEGPTKRMELKGWCGDCQPKRSPRVCSCQKVYIYDEVFMVKCSMCQAWYHGKCVGVKESDEFDEEWRCDECADLVAADRALPANLIDENLDKEAQTEQIWNAGIFFERVGELHRWCATAARLASATAEGGGSREAALEALRSPEDSVRRHLAGHEHAVSFDDLKEMLSAVAPPTDAAAEGEAGQLLEAGEGYPLAQYGCNDVTGALQPLLRDLLERASAWEAEAQRAAEEWKSIAKGGAHIAGGVLKESEAGALEALLERALLHLSRRPCRLLLLGRAGESLALVCDKIKWLLLSRRVLSEGDLSFKDAARLTYLARQWKLNRLADVNAVYAGVHDKVAAAKDWTARHRDGLLFAAAPVESVRIDADGAASVPEPPSRLTIAAIRGHAALREASALPLAPPEASAIEEAARATLRWTESAAKLLRGGPSDGELSSLRDLCAQEVLAVDEAAALRAFLAVLFEATAARARLAALAEAPRPRAADLESASAAAARALEAAAAWPSALERAGAALPGAGDAEAAAARRVEAAAGALRAAHGPAAAALEASRAAAAALPLDLSLDEGLPARLERYLAALSAAPAASPEEELCAWLHEASALDAPAPATDERVAAVAELRQRAPRLPQGAPGAKAVAGLQQALLGRKKDLLRGLAAAQRLQRAAAAALERRAGASASAVAKLLAEAEAEGLSLELAPALREGLAAARSWEAGVERLLREPVGALDAFLSRAEAAEAERGGLFACEDAAEALSAGAEAARRASKLRAAPSGTPLEARRALWQGAMAAFDAAAPPEGAPGGGLRALCLAALSEGYEAWCGAAAAAVGASRVLSEEAEALDAALEALPGPQRAELERRVAAGPWAPLRSAIAGEAAKAERALAALSPLEAAVEDARDGLALCDRPALLALRAAAEQAAGDLADTAVLFPAERRARALLGLAAWLQDAKGALRAADAVLRRPTAADAPAYAAYAAGAEDRVPLADLVRLCAAPPALSAPAGGALLPNAGLGAAVERLGELRDLAAAFEREAEDALAGGVDARGAFYEVERLRRLAEQPLHGAVDVPAAKKARAALAEERRLAGEAAEALRGEGRAGADPREGLPALEATLRGLEGAFAARPRLLSAARRAVSQWALPLAAFFRANLDALLGLGGAGRRMGDAAWRALLEGARPLLLEAPPPTLEALRELGALPEGAATVLEAPRPGGALGALLGRVALLAAQADAAEAWAQGAEALIAAASGGRMTPAAKAERAAALLEEERRLKVRGDARKLVILQDMRKAAPAAAPRKRAAEAPAAARKRAKAERDGGAVELSVFHPCMGPNCRRSARAGCCFCGDRCARRRASETASALRALAREAPRAPEDRAAAARGPSARRCASSRTCARGRPAPSARACRCRTRRGRRARRRRRRGRSRSTAAAARARRARAMRRAQLFGKMARGLAACGLRPVVSAAEAMAWDLEEEALVESDGAAYKKRVTDLVYALGDPGHRGMMDQVAQGGLSMAKLVRMSPAERRATKGWRDQRAAEIAEARLRENGPPPEAPARQKPPKRAAGGEAAAPAAKRPREAEAEAEAEAPAAAPAPAPAPRREKKRRPPAPIPSIDEGAEEAAGARRPPPPIPSLEESAPAERPAAPPPIPSYAAEGEEEEGPRAGFGEDEAVERISSPLRDGDGGGGGGGAARADGLAALEETRVFKYKGFEDFSLRIFAAKEDLPSMERAVKGAVRMKGRIKIPMIAKYVADVRRDDRQRKVCIEFVAEAASEADAPAEEALRRMFLTNERCGIAEFGKGAVTVYLCPEEFATGCGLLRSTAGFRWCGFAIVKTAAGRAT